MKTTKQEMENWLPEDEKNLYDGTTAEDLSEILRSQSRHDAIKDFEPKITDHGDLFLVEGGKLGFDKDKKEAITVDKNDGLIVFHSENEMYVVGTLHNLIHGKYDIEDLISEGRKLRDGIEKNTAEFKQDRLKWVDRAISGRDETEKRGVSGFSKS